MRPAARQRSERIRGKEERVSTRTAEPSDSAGAVELLVMDLETALLTESALSDWNRSEEDEAWSHLQPAR